MKRVRSRLLAALAIAAAFPLGAEVAAADLAEQLRPINLRVAGGEANWHAENEFRLDWDQPPIAGPEFPIAAVEYRVRDATGAVVVPTVRRPWETNKISDLSVPPHPGVYTAEVWLEGPNGARGLAASTTLRFDDAKPAGVRPLAPSGWISGTAAAVIPIEHPAAPRPLSGIRGYAVSVDRGGGSVPCTAPGWCSISETDLRGGIEDDTLSLGLLQEGISVVRAVAVSGSGVSSAAIGSATVRVDATRPEVTLTGLTRGWASGPVRLLASATDALSGMAAAGPSGPYTAIAVDGEVPKLEAGSSTAVTVSGEGAHRIAFFARDAAGNAGDGSPATATVSIDESPPEVAFARAQDPAEPERIEAVVADALSGPDQARGTIALRPAGSRQRWLALATTVTAGRLLGRWNSDAFPPGTYEFRATGYDLAGNSRVAERRGNGVRMVLRNPIKAPTGIEAGFGGRRLVWHRCAREAERRRCRQEEIGSFAGRPTARAVPYGRGVAYSGRVVAPPGLPVGNLPVEIVESFGDGAGAARRSSTVTTAADGSFTSRLSPGPSRQVEAVFPGTRVLTRAGGGAVHLAVLAGVRLQTSSSSAQVGGSPVVFNGRVGDLGAPVPAGGLPVELQFKVPGGEWSEFRTVQTDPSGRFRYAYAFSDDDSRGVRFQFRAYMSGGDWPYEPAASKAISVTGR